VGIASPAVSAAAHALACAAMLGALAGGCMIGDDGELALAGDDADDVGVIAAAGSGDRYACVTTSEPGCDFRVGIGRSLFGAGECRPGVDFHVSAAERDRSRPLVLAIHGGRIEDGTAQLAAMLVAELGWSSYVFRATPTSNTCEEVAWMHVTSTRFNSATARQLVRTHPAAVSLHGYSEQNPGRAGWPQDRWFVCVGGSHARARARFIASLNQAAFTIDQRRVHAVDATAAGSATSSICGGLGGTSAANIANLPRDGGLQLELPRRLRARLAGLDGLAPNSTLRARTIAAVRAAFAP
jgi:phage replication-related protein YjqB (UPF0714/DUF867 family)